MRRAFRARHRVRREDKQHVAASPRMKGPLHLLKQLSAARSDQVLARESRDDVRLLKQPIANDRLCCEETVAREQRMILLQEDLIVFDLLNEGFLGG